MDPRVVPDDRLVVVREAPVQPVGIDESARSEQKERPREAEALARHGVIGRFGIDYVSVRGSDGWKHYAIEVNRTPVASASEIR